MSAISSSSKNASFNLPAYFVYRPLLNIFPNYYVLLKASFYLPSSHKGPSDLKIYKLELVEYPRLTIERYRYKTNGNFTNPEEFFIHTMSGVKSNIIYRSSNYFDSGTTSIYEYCSENLLENYTIPYNFINEFIEKYCNDFHRLSQWVFEEYHFEHSSFISSSLTNKKKEVKNTKPPAIPPHVFKILVEAIIAKNEICPISMEPLKYETVAGLPCGHLFEKSSLTQALESKGECPVCRKSVSKEDIQTC